MTIVEEIEKKFNVGDVSVDASGITWFATGNLDPCGLAQFFREVEARFVTITAYQLPGDGGFCLEYLWDNDGKLLGFPFYLSGSSMPSIFSTCEAADWIEREIHEEFCIDFTGREYEPLLLREGDRTGVNLREVAK